MVRGDGEQRHRAVVFFFGDDRRGACEIIGMRDLISSPSWKRVYMKKCWLALALELSTATATPVIFSVIF